MHTKVCIKQFKAWSCDRFWGVWFVEDHMSSTKCIDAKKINPVLTDAFYRHGCTLSPFNDPLTIFAHLQGYCQKDIAEMKVSRLHMKVIRLERVSYYQLTQPICRPFPACKIPSLHLVHTAIVSFALTTCDVHQHSNNAASHLLTSSS